jgi:glycogen debranching enzyme
VPSISTLDNFYAKQYEDGEISREIVRATGVDFPPWVNREGKPLFSRWGWPGYQEEASAEHNAPVIYKKRGAALSPPYLTLDALNHPILAWAELESYRVTGDADRLHTVWEPLGRWYRALQKYLLQGNGLYITDWASMDNSPRNRPLQGGGTGVDTSAEMVLFARHLSQIAKIIGKPDASAEFAHEADSPAQLINRHMWDKKRKFYFDLQLSGKRAPVKTIAAYWTVLAQVASPLQASVLVDELNNPATFGRRNRVPTLAADESGYDPAGGYWRGAVWAPTETLVIRGLENYGHHELARQIALSHLDMVAQVFRKTGTIWENYSPDAVQQGRPAKGNFVGWSGIGPIVYLLEYALGLKADAPQNQLVGHLQPGGRQGCERFRFNGHVASRAAEPAAGTPGKIRISVESDGEFRLQVHCQGAHKDFSVVRGEQESELGP